MLEITNRQHSEKDLFLSGRLCYNLNAAQNIFSIFNKLSIFGENCTFTQSYSVRVVLEVFKFCFQFLYDKRELLMKM